MSQRAFNFSAGPAMLPEEVLAVAQENLANYQGSGVGVMEMSHRSAAFEEIIATAEKNLRSLLGLSDDFAVLFMTGGASNQFSALPLCFLSDNQVGNYIVSGYWAEKAAAEAKRFRKVHIAASSKDKNHNYIPTKLEISENPGYVHFTSNNTIFGTQFQSEPNVGNAPLICDASSDMLCRKIDISKYSLIYAGAQKNLGPAGVTLVVVKKSLLERIPENVPLMLDYNTFAKNGSMYNTPPTFPIYIVGEVFKWLLKNGGIDGIEKRNRDKAALIYNVIDSSNGFYAGHAEKNFRSLMNVTFKLKTPELEAEFLKDAKSKGFLELKGHRSVGGIRASIYNAFPRTGIEALVNFMSDFAKKH